MNSTVVDFFKGKTENTETKCIGLFFRFKESIFINSKKEIVYTKKLTPLKKRSCPGCKYCEWYTEWIGEDVLNGFNPLLGSMDDGAMYKMKYHVFDEDDVEISYAKVAEVTP